ncbi:MAG: PadR family transcriptional regulator [Actinomycetota bacterium]|nr:PadR family transcriptional regulator [Acidimicrobiia bacterium]MDQ3293658.1 PadR family transcriptional regulator [Actinomycetota bacterium]
MERRPTLSLNEWAVLGLLVERARHGYDIAAELRSGTALGDVWRVDRPLVYRAIERLDALGLVAPRRQEQGTAGPRRTIYGPTRRGRSALRAWLATPVVHLRDIRSALLLKLALVRRLGIDPVPLIEAQREALAPRFEQLAAPPDDPADLAGLWRHHSADAAVAFLDALARRSTVAVSSSWPRTENCPAS